MLEEQVPGDLHPVKEEVEYGIEQKYRGKVDRAGTCTPCRPSHQLEKRRSSIWQSAVLSEEPCHLNPIPSAQHQLDHPLRSAPVGSGGWGFGTQSVTTNKETTTNGYRNAHLAQKLELFIKRVKAQIRSFFKKNRDLIVYTSSESTSSSLDLDTALEVAQ